MGSTDLIALACVLAAVLIVAAEVVVERRQRNPRPTPGRKRLP